MNTINILNGESLKQYLEEKFNFKGNNISFNECLIDGDVHKEIFSKEFFEIRGKFISEYFNVPSEVYIKNTEEELSELLKGDCNTVDLWFDYDMFCQINMLTILAYLEYTKFQGKVNINLIYQDFHKYNNIDNIIEMKVEIKSLNKFYDLYTDVMINKEFSKIFNEDYNNIFKELPFLKSGLRLYYIYKTTNHEIESFIKERLNKSKHEILIDLLNEFQDYGLGDVQFIKVLEKVR